MIDLKNIHKTYGKSKAATNALSNINYTIKEGEFITITGKSGSGKSTLLNILGGITKPSLGDYWFCGENISKYTLNELSLFRKENVGFVVQHFALIDNMKVFDNIALPLKYNNYSNNQIRAMVGDVLEKLEISNKIHNYPHELSGGEKQRVAIARAIISSPKILLADEPTGALDERTGKNILNIFKELNNNGTTIVLVTHDKEIADIGSKQIIMRDGKIYKS